MSVGLVHNQIRRPSAMFNIGAGVKIGLRPVAAQHPIDQAMAPLPNPHGMIIRQSVPLGQVLNRMRLQGVGANG